MSSSEPPSRIPPRGQSHETKSARDELASKGKVEKIREVDSDETRKRKFLKYYDEDHSPNADAETAGRPTPFDLLSGKPPQGPGPMVDEGMDDAIVPSPSYTSPPDLSSSIDMEEPEDEATTGALPQSDGFWEDVDFPPDRPAPPRSFQETPQSAQPGRSSPSNQGGQSPSGTKKGQPAKKQETSPFGPPGKPIQGAASSAAKPEKKGAPTSKEEAKKKLPSPFEESTIAPSKSAAKKPSDSFAETGPQAKPVEKEEERSPTIGSAPGKPGKRGVTSPGQGDITSPGFGVPPLQHEDREGGGGKRGREQKTIAIEGPSLPELPPQIQPIAAAAATQATPYIHPSTVSLFFQMVGTMYVMASPTGVARTEIVLNNPSYANSKFYGATIRVEKYATAPDSFNITLSGPDEAVASFRTNIPSLMAAFQNGNFAFKVNRLDVEYKLERPVYHRREKGGDKGESGGGDLGERRK